MAMATTIGYGNGNDYWLWLRQECRSLLLLKAHAESSDTERNLIGHRTQSDRTPNAIRSDGGRNLIGRRTQSDRTADASGGKSITYTHAKLNIVIFNFKFVIYKA